MTPAEQVRAGAAPEDDGLCVWLVGGRLRCWWRRLWVYDAAGTPDSLRGVAYARVEGVREPTRVRSAYVTDQDIRAMAALYAPGASPGARLAAVMEGRGGELVMTPAQRREVDEMRAAWREQCGELP